MGSIQIPSLGLTQPVFDGVWLSVLDVGPGHWPGTAAFGGEGNVVIGGHRVTHGAPFRDLDRLRPDDVIMLQDRHRDIHVPSHVIRRRRPGRPLDRRPAPGSLAHPVHVPPTGFVPLPLGGDGRARRLS